MGVLRSSPGLGHALPLVLRGRQSSSKCSPLPSQCPGQGISASEVCLGAAGHSKAGGSGLRSDSRPQQAPPHTSQLWGWSPCRSPGSLPGIPELTARAEGQVPICQDSPGWFWKDSAHESKGHGGQPHPSGAGRAGVGEKRWKGVDLSEGSELGRKDWPFSLLPCAPGEQPRGLTSPFSVGAASTLHLALSPSAFLLLLPLRNLVQSRLWS